LTEVKKTILNLTNCNCNKKKQLLFELSISLEEKYTQYFIDNGYSNNKLYIKNGLLYIEDIYLVAIGPFGSNRLQIKCKIDNCDIGIDKLESILKLL
jgi:hypothetical protein